MTEGYGAVNYFGAQRSAPSACMPTCSAQHQHTRKKLAAAYDSKDISTLNALHHQQIHASVQRTSWLYRHIYQFVILPFTPTSSDSNACVALQADWPHMKSASAVA